MRLRSIEHQRKRNLVSAIFLDLVVNVGIIVFGRKKSCSWAVVKWQEKNKTWERSCKADTWNTKLNNIKVRLEFQHSFNAQGKTSSWRQAKSNSGQVGWGHCFYQKRVLLAEAKPLLTENQKLTLNHVKTYLLEKGKGFLCPAVKKNTVAQVWNCAFPDKSWLTCV